MRCFVRNAGAVLAMIWSGAAAAAIAGPVTISTSGDLTVAAMVQVDSKPASDIETWAKLMARPHGVDDIAPPPSVPLVAAPPTPAAIEIPLPSSAWLGLAGMSSACFFVARVFTPVVCNAKTDDPLAA